MLKTLDTTAEKVLCNKLQEEGISDIRHMDIVDARLTWPRVQFSENITKAPLFKNTNKCDTLSIYISKKYRKKIKFLS